LFLRYLSANYEESAKKELGSDYPGKDALTSISDDGQTASTNPLTLWYEENAEDVSEFENQMRRKVHYVIKPEHLWSNITELARTQSSDLLITLEGGFRYIENE